MQMSSNATEAAANNRSECDCHTQQEKFLANISSFWSFTMEEKLIAVLGSLYDVSLLIYRDIHKKRHLGEGGRNSLDMQ